MRNILKKNLLDKYKETYITNSSPDIFKLEFAESEENAKKILDNLLIANPNNHVLLLRRLNMSINENDYNLTIHICKQISNIDFLKPYWFILFNDALNTKIISIFDLSFHYDYELMNLSVLRALSLGEYEKEEVDILLSHANVNDSILELGTGIGFLGIVAKKKLNIKNFISFEANPNLTPLINKNKQLNNCEFESNNKTIGLANKIVDFNVSDNYCESSLLDLNKKCEKISVEMIKFDDIIREREINFLIIDIEGAEFDLIPNVDLNKINKILIELHPQFVNNKKYSYLIKYLLNNQFIIDTDTSTNNVLFFYKT